jgi:Tripartite tricarboxylate transporter family receptor
MFESPYLSAHALGYFFGTFATVHQRFMLQHHCNLSIHQEMIVHLLKRLFVSSVLVTMLTCTAQLVWAQSVYPDKPVKLVIPFAAGGATDVLGRLLAVSMQDKLGQSVVVENKPGAGTVLAAS